MIKILTMLIIFMTSTVFCQENEIVILNKNIDLSVPLYEYSSSFFRDYRVNQTIQESIKWSSISVIPSVLILASGDAEGFILPLVAISIPIGGFIGGGVNGYHNGVKFNQLKRSDPSFQLNRNKFGYEAEAYTTTSNGLTFFNSKGSLCYQSFENKKYFPSEYRLGVSFLKSVWYEDDDELASTPFYSYKENRIDFNAIYNSNQTYFQFHYGFGGGYSWGKHTIETSSDITTNKLNGAYIYPLAGITINFNDFFYCRVEGRYELSQFYYKLLDYADYPHYSNISVGFVAGTYIF
ncbi:MAG: hypothetical protein PF638_07850 [Candidatus Delongbacteria bacterium]|jgi:hypothetical protein|nr:hypothetical protein [Candidatus Delongbacteria bacterium]